jgi:hypothetical protein
MLDYSNEKILQAESLLNWQMSAADRGMTRTQWPGEVSIEQVPNLRALEEQHSVDLIRQAHTVRGRRGRNIRKSAPRAAGASDLPS